MTKKKFIKYMTACLSLMIGYYLFGNIGLLIGLAVLFVWK